MPISAPSLLVLGMLNFRKPLMKPKPAYTLPRQSSRDLCSAEALHTAFLIDLIVRCDHKPPVSPWLCSQSHLTTLLLPVPVGRRFHTFSLVWKPQTPPSLSRLSADDFLSLTKISGDPSEFLRICLSYPTHSGVCTYTDGSPSFSPHWRGRDSVMGMTRH